jgi:hypothetical protein
MLFHLVWTLGRVYVFFFFILSSVEQGFQGHLQAPTLPVHQEVLATTLFIDLDHKADIIPLACQFSVVHAVAGLQIATNSISEGITAAQMAADAGADWIDLNCGCPIYGTPPPPSPDLFAFSLPYPVGHMTVKRKSCRFEILCRRH